MRPSGPCPALPAVGGLPAEHDLELPEGRDLAAAARA
jgi:hypothetical protein